jgi:hypothetical protein
MTAISTENLGDTSASQAAPALRPYRVCEDVFQTDDREHQEGDAESVPQVGKVQEKP